MRREMLRLFALTSLVNLLNIQSKKKFFLLSISIAIFLCFLFMFFTVSMCIYGDIINETIHMEPLYCYVESCGVANW